MRSPRGRPAATRRTPRAARRKRTRSQRSHPAGGRLLDEGKPRDTFIVGALLSLPGGAYLAGLAQISQQDLSTSLTVLTVLGFTIVMMVILEVPLLGYTFAPHSTIRTVERFQAWVTKDAHKIGTWAALILGALLLLRGVDRADQLISYRSRIEGDLTQAEPTTRRGA